MADLIVRPQWLIINGYTFGTPAAHIRSFLPLYGMPELAGRNVDFDGGVRPYALFATTTSRLLTVQVNGDRKRDGDLHGDQYEGLEFNLEEIFTVVCARPATRAGTVEAEWHRRDGSVWLADLHVIQFEPGDLAPGAAECSLSLSIPSGRFVEAP